MQEQTQNARRNNAPVSTRRTLTTACSSAKFGTTTGDCEVSKTVDKPGDVVLVVPDAADIAAVCLSAGGSRCAARRQDSCYGAVKPHHIRTISKADSPT